jgi:hypothetical protein
MPRSITATSITAVACAGFVAVLVVVLTAAGPTAKAAPLAASTTLAVKGDRLPARVSGTACSTHAWPGYEPGCQFDRRMPAYAARTVRVIALQ